MEAATQTGTDWRRYATPAAVFALVLVPLVLNLAISRFTDSDGFYHIRHASLYLEHGPLWQEFPWLTKSVIGERGADIWYGFHLALALFSLIPDPMLSLRVAQAACLSFLLLCVYFVCRRNALPAPAAWPLILLCATPLQAWRWLALRPYFLSLGLGVLALHFVCSRRPWAAAVCALLISFTHSAFFWLAPAVALAALLAELAKTRRVLWREFLAVTLAAGLGLFLRPDAIDALAVLKVQLIDHSAAVRQGLPLAYANEVPPLTWGDVGSGYTPILAIWLLLGLPAMAIRGMPPAGIASLALSGAFFVAALTMSFRAVEVWLVFGALGMGFGMKALAEHYLAPRAERVRSMLPPTLAAASVLGLGAWTIPWTIGWIEYRGLNVFRFEKAMAWLKENSPKDSVVYHPDWAYFGEMFFWNTHNRYITGMDPIFLYTYDKRLYWKHHRLESDRMTRQTSGAGPGEPPALEETYTVLTRDFGAQYIFVDAAAHMRFFGYVQQDARYREVFRDGDVAVFMMAVEN